MNQQGKDLAVESIRGIACIMVLISHISLIYFPYIHNFDGLSNSFTRKIQHLIHHSPFCFIFSGTSAVFIFFFLSGYILTKVYYPKTPNSIHKIASMIIKRYSRLMIPSVASCVFAYFLFTLFDYPSSSNLSDWGNKIGNFKMSFLNSIYDGFIDVFFVSGYSEYNPVLWTMKIEFLGSILIFLLCIKSFKNFKFYNTFFLLIAIVISIFYKLLNIELGLGMLSFLGGFFMYHFDKKVPFIIAIILLTIGLYFAGIHNDSSAYSTMISIFNDNSYLVGNFISGFLIVYTIIFNPKLNHLFSNKPMVILGKYSFSIYLIHLPILATFGLFSFDKLYSLTNNYLLSSIFVIILSIILIFSFAVAFYKIVDYPSIKLGKFFSKKIISSISN